MFIMSLIGKFLMATWYFENYFCHLSKKFVGIFPLIQVITYENRCHRSLGSRGPLTPAEEEHLAQ